MNNLLITEDEEELARSAASVILAKAREHLADPDKRFHWMLSGGSTPRALYKLLSSIYPRAIDWARVSFFWGDERDVLPDDKDSNFRMAEETLLGPLGIRQEQIFRFEPEKGSPDEVAAQYEHTLRYALLDSETQPHIDSLLLGLGEDGHTASLFPDSREQWKKADRRGRWTCATWVPHLQAHRFTVLPNLLRSARQTLFLVGGKNKSAILKQVMENRSSPPRYPAQLFLSRALWIVDRSAAQRLIQAA